MFDIWNKVMNTRQIPMNISGISALATFRFQQDPNRYLKTFLTQEILHKHNMLASNIFYLSTVHTNKDLLNYEIALNYTLEKAKTLLYSGALERIPLGSVAHSKFNRLN